MKKLIVNADDFGLTRSITDGIIKGASNGIVRSVSFIVNTDAFEYSVMQAKRFPGLDIGIHITWVGEDGPVAENVESLVSDKNFYQNWKWVVVNRLLKRIKLSDAEREARAQIEKLLIAGIQPSHIDSHQHLHLLPGFSEIILGLAEEYNIPFIRCPETNGKRFFYINYLSKRLRKVLKRKNFPEQPASLGFEWRGRFSLSALAKIVNSLYSDVSELIIHPGFEDEHLHNKYRWGYNWERELDCILSEEAKKILNKNNVKLTSFKELEQDIKSLRPQNTD